jgi:hypothetical protein
MLSPFITLSRPAPPRSEDGAQEAGGLMNGEDSIDHGWRRSTAQVGKILKGAKPGDLPIEQPTTFELGIT